MTAQIPPTPPAPRSGAFLPAEDADVEQQRQALLDLASDSGGQQNTVELPYRLEKQNRRAERARGRDAHRQR